MPRNNEYLYECCNPNRNQMQEDIHECCGPNSCAKLQEDFDEGLNPHDDIPIKFDEVVEASNIIKSHVISTPCLPSNNQKHFEMNLFYKLENMQRTGSFKERGAVNALLNLAQDEKKAGVVTAALGNEGIAMSYHGAKLHIPVIVVMPITVPISLVSKCHNLGSTVVVQGNDLAEAQIYAKSIAKTKSLTFINGRDHPDVLNGYGTVGLEILQEIPDVDVVLVPVGTGGLVAAVAATIKEKKPNCQIYGIQPENTPFFYKTLKGGNFEPFENESTMAESVNVTYVGKNSFSNAQSLISKMLLVREKWIARAILHMYEKQRLVVEGAAACPVAAIMSGLVPELKSKNVVAIVTGGNTDLLSYTRCIQRGLSAEDRLVKFTVKINDNIFAKTELFKLITESGCNVENSFELHRWIDDNVYKAEICLTCRTKNSKNAQELKEILESVYTGAVRFENKLPVTNEKAFKSKVTTCREDDTDGDAGDFANEAPEIYESLALQFKDIKDAAVRIEDGIVHTPLYEAKISKYMEYNIYLKCENLQYTGSCVERGIRNIFEANYIDYSRRGVIVPSSGNMALAAAYHGGIMGVPVTVVMPDRTPPALSQWCSELGADVVLVGDTLQDAIAYAEKTQETSNQALISSDDPLMMAGLGTIGLEIMNQLDNVDAVIVPVSSGGLLAAVLLACKKLHCSCLVYGVECAVVPTLTEALKAGQPVSVSTLANLAEKLNAPTVGAKAFDILKGRLDRMLLVEEESIARAVVTLLERERLVADGAGACALAAVMQGLVPELKGKRTVCVISGGNIEAGRLTRVIQRGLGANGRLVRFAVELADHRFSLEKLAKMIAEEKAVMKSLVTEQMWLHSDVGSTWVNVVVEAANEDHSGRIKGRIKEQFPTVKFAISDKDDQLKLTF